MSTPARYQYRQTPTPNKNYGVDQPFLAASTSKVIAAAAYYHLVEQGKASLDQPMGAFNARFQLKLMINQSDNDAWHQITSAVTMPRLKAYSSSIGITYGNGGNQLSARDMASVLSQLYSGTLLNRQHTDQLLGYMQHTNDNDLIPLAVPPTVTVFHKYGQLDGNLHDAAILRSGDQTYALVIYTKGAENGNNYRAQTSVIHQITEAVASELKL